jgi:succinate dehydrogenase / fumarate reductase cytochrome b subunit
MAMSILHRATGVGLALGLPVMVAWVLSIANGPEAYATMNGYLSSTIGKIFLFGWLWAFCFHLCTGIRHLLWDAGLFLELKGVYSTGRIAIAVSTLLTIGLWLKMSCPGSCPYMP